MALMPEDLENKRFTPVRFSEGYDMDEVDDYLDHEILPRLRELIDENDRLTKELDEAHNRIAQLESAAQERPQQPSYQEPAASVAERAPENDATAPQQLVTDPGAQSQQASSLHAAHQLSQGSDDSAAGIIALANRLHDEYVREGEQERERMLSDAKQERQRIISDAEETSRATLENLETQKADLERSIDSLRTFERDYRNRLRSYLESQLRDLESTQSQEKQANFGL